MNTTMTSQGGGFDTACNFAFDFFYLEPTWSTEIDDPAAQLFCGRVKILYNKVSALAFV